jgi:peptidyl-prolyl cis-trans isomerase C
MRRIVRAGALVTSAAVGLGTASAQQQPLPSMPPAAAQQQPSPDTPAATVNGEVIRLGDVDAYIKSKLALGPLTPVQARQLRTDVVSDMIDDVLLRQFLRQHGPKVESAEVDRHLKALGESLAKQGKTLADFYRETRQTEAQARETWMTLLQLSGYVKQRVTDEQLRQYHAANRDVFDRVEVKVSHIMIRASAHGPPVERAAAREKLQALRAEIAAGRVDFADMARRYSQCPSAPLGGDLGFIPRKGMLDEPFAKAAFALKPGDVSGVVETDSGVHLIRVTARKPGTPSTFEACAEDVREAFTDDFRAELVARLRKQGQIQISIP